MSSSSAASLKPSPVLKLNNGLTMPAIGLGTWRSEKGQVEAAVYAALKMGYRHLDCARVYKNEAEVGTAIKRALDEGILKREELFVTSKIWNYSHTEALVNDAMGKILADLQLEYLDLLLIHWPVNFVYRGDDDWWPKDAGSDSAVNEMDPNKASIKQAWQAMEKLVQQGKVKSIGLSNFNTAQIDEVLSYAQIQPAALQIEVHPYWPQDEMLAYCRSKGILVQAYSPLGNLKREGQEDFTPLNDPVIQSLAQKHRVSPAQVILRWGLQHGQVVLPKSVSENRIRENFDLQGFELSAEDMQTIKAIPTRKRMVNPNFAPNGSLVFPQ